MPFYFLVEFGPAGIEIVLEISGEDKAAVPDRVEVILEKLVAQMLYRISYIWWSPV